MILIRTGISAKWLLAKHHVTIPFSDGMSQFWSLGEDHTIVKWRPHASPALPHLPVLQFSPPIYLPPTSLPFLLPFSPLQPTYPSSAATPSDHHLLPPTADEAS